MLSTPWCSLRAAEEEKEGECCGEKRVGNVLYQLFSEGDVKQLARWFLMSISSRSLFFHRYNCLSGCIYKDEEDPQGVRLQNYKMGPTWYFSQPSFCFARGDLPVECMDDFHWCYEGDCGPEFWETRFEVYLRIENFGALWVSFWQRSTGLCRREPISDRCWVAREQFGKCSIWGAQFRGLWQGKKLKMPYYTARVSY